MTSAKLNRKTALHIGKGHIGDIKKVLTDYDSIKASRMNNCAVFLLVK